MPANRPATNGEYPARLQISSLAGYSPLVAGRFAGIGNAAYGVFAPAVLLAGAALAGSALAGRSLQVALAITAVLGLVAIVVDGSPAWGSDVGGVLALMPGVAVLVLGCAGSRVSWPRPASRSWPASPSPTTSVRGPPAPTWAGSSTSCCTAGRAP